MWFLRKAVIYHQRCRDSSYQGCWVFFLLFSLTLCSKATFWCHYQEREIFWGSALFYLDFVLIPCSGETLTNLIFNAKIQSKTLSLLKANKSLVHLDSIYYDFCFVATNSNTALANCFIGKTTPNPGSITEQFIKNICKTFLVQFITKFTEAKITMPATT